MINNKPMKINQFKNKLRKNITSLKIGGTNNTQNKPQRKTLFGDGMLLMNYS